MNIEEYKQGLEEIYKNKAEEKRTINKQILDLEKEPIVQNYNNLKKELGYLEYKYSKHTCQSDMKQECDHPMFIYDTDLVSQDYIVPCARCILCGELIYDTQGLKLTELFNNKRLIAKEVQLRDNFYDFGYIDYKINANEIRDIYYKLYKISNYGEYFNVEDYLFDHLTGNNPSIRRREK